MVPHPTTDFDQAKRDLDQHGLCVISDVLGSDEIAEARTRLLEQASAERERGLDFRDGGADQQVIDDDGVFNRDGFSTANGGVNQRLWLLINKGRCFRDMVEHELVDELVGHVLGPDFILSTHSANITMPGGVRMGLHTDQWWMPHPVAPNDDYVRASAITRTPVHASIEPDVTIGINPPVVANTMWMLNDFTIDNGATEVVPGSHLSGSQPHPTNQGDYPIEQVTGPAGSVMVFDGRLWHGTGANTGEDWRLGVLATFCAPQFRQQENQVLGLDRRLWPELSDKLKRRLGFSPWNAYGRLESPADEWVEPEPTRIPELS